MNDNTEVKIEETTEKQFSMTLSGGEEVISLGRDVVRGLNVPSFIKILVSEDYDEIVFTPCAEKEHMSFKVPEKVFTQHSGMRMYSKAFVHDVLVRNGFDKTKTYNFKGRYLNEQKNAIVFPLTIEEKE